MDNIDSIVLTQEKNGKLALQKQVSEDWEILFTGTPKQMQGVAVMILEVVKALAIQSN